MRRPRTTTRFERDVRLAERRGKDLGKLRRLMLLLAAGEPLPANYRDHALKGEWGGCRDAHVEPDWVLIYRLETENTIYFERTGTHSDLFDE
ncbi:MAG: type II toxin-antitoxin system YafQ family toxin [Devosia sp.]|nr:type II toxin-antitoxin system YafQ family toxin [Devosia sp.]